MSDTINLSNMDTILQKFLNDKYVTSSIILFLILYTVLIVPNISDSSYELLNSPLFKLLFLLVIGYIATKNQPMGIIAAIAFLVTIFTIQKNELNNKFVSIAFVGAIKDDKLNEVKIPENLLEQEFNNNKLDLAQDIMIDSHLFENPNLQHVTIDNQENKYQDEHVNLEQFDVDIHPYNSSTNYAMF